MIEKMNELESKYMLEIAKKRKNSFSNAFSQRKDEKTSAIIQRVYYNKQNEVELKGKEAQ